MTSYVVHTNKTSDELEQLGLTCIGEIIYAIVVDDVQEYAKRRIGRELTDDELYSAKKGISSGLSYGIDVAYTTAIDEAVSERRKH